MQEVSNVKKAKKDVNTGKLKTTSDLVKEKIIKASYNLPTTRLDNDKNIDDFFSDDGGY